VAPEYATKLVVWTLECQDGILQGPVEYYESVPDTVLRIRWKAKPCPAGFREVGNGLACVALPEGQDPVPPSEGEEPTSLGESRYRWQEGFRPVDSSLNLMLVLPEDYTARNVQPPPTKAKDFETRIALCWTLPRVGPEPHKIVEWDLVPLEGAAASEAERINRLDAQGYVPAETRVVMEDLPYNLSAVRDLLMAALTAPDLRRLVQYTPNEELKAVRDRFGPNDSLMEMVDTTLEYCEKQLLLSDLLQEVEWANPNQFQRFAARLASR
jgi:hypothetical protein